MLEKDQRFNQELTWNAWKEMVLMNLKILNLGAIV